MTPSPKRSLIATTVSLIALLAPASAVAGDRGRTISTAGLSLQIPSGWQAQIAKTPACDPERLIVASSAPTHIGPIGQLASPRAGMVLVVLLEDRYRQDHPVGNLRRPQHFSATWNRLAQIKPACGLPAAPAYLRYFKTHGRYLGFIVYPGTPVNAETRARTLRLLDSLDLNS